MEVEEYLGRGKIASHAKVPESNSRFGTVFANGAFAISSHFKRRGKARTTS